MNSENQTMKASFLAALPLAITATLLSPHLARAAGAATTIHHHDTTSFQRVLAARGIDNLQTEDFEDSFARFLPANEFAACIEPVGSHSNDACFERGGMPDGVRISSGSRFGVIVLGTEILGSESLVGGGWPYRLSPSSINDTVLDFDDGPTVISLDVFGFGIDSGWAVGSAPIVVEVFDLDGVMRDSFQVQGTGPSDPSVVAIDSEVPIGQIRIGADIQAAGAMIDNLVFGGGPGRLEATPATVEFGTIAVGDAALLPVSFTNRGYLDAVVGDVPAPAEPFVLDEDDCSGATLAPGESCTVMFAFVPGYGDLFSADIDIPVAEPGRGATLSFAGSASATGGAQ
jgi:hypothetical protein